MTPQTESKIAILVSEKYKHTVQNIVKLLEDDYELVHFQTGSFIVYSFSKEKGREPIQLHNQKN